MSHWSLKLKTQYNSHEQHPTDKYLGVNRTKYVQDLYKKKSAKQMKKIKEDVYKWRDKFMDKKIQYVKIPPEKEQAQSLSAQGLPIVYWFLT